MDNNLTAYTTLYVNEQGLYSITNGKKPFKYAHAYSSQLPIAVQISLETLKEWNITQSPTNEQTQNKKLLFD